MGTRHTLYSDDLTAWLEQVASHIPVVYTEDPIEGALRHGPRGSAGYVGYLMGRIEGCMLRYGMLIKYDRIKEEYNDQRSSG